MKPKVIAPIPYKTAQVYVGENDRFINLSYYSLTTKKYHRKKIRISEKGIPLDQKIEMLHEACKLLNVELRNRNAKLIYHETVTSNAVIHSGDFLSYFDMIINDNQLSGDRRETVQALKKVILEFYNVRPVFDNSIIANIDETWLNEFVLFTKEKNRAGKTINKYLATIEFVSEYLKRKKISDIVINTGFYRVNQPKNETGRFPPLTNDEMIKIFSYYKDWQGSHYYLFLLFVHYTCIRPAELHRLKVGNLDFENRTVFIPWYSSKNGLSRYVQLLDPLFDALIEMQINLLPTNYFLFGKMCKPSTNEYRGCYSSEVWAAHRERVGLPIEKQLYGLKHTFNTNYINNNKDKADWEWLRRHNRHSSIKQTQDYISEITAYFLDQKTNVIINYHV